MSKELIYKELCDDCPFGYEAGMCESRGAIYKHGDWHPTLLCVPDLEAMVIS